MDTPRVCIPVGLQKRLIAQAHKGHAGIIETLHKLRERGYFPGMSQQGGLSVNNCIPCLQKSNQVPSGQGKSMHRELHSKGFTLTQ